MLRNRPKRALKSFTQYARAAASSAAARRKLAATPRREDYDELHAEREAFERHVRSLMAKKARKDAARAAVALPAHEDLGDVLVLQLLGEKTWSIDGRDDDVTLKPGDGGSAFSYLAREPLRRRSDSHAVHMDAQG